MANEKPVKLDMSFEEALRRLAQTDVTDLPEGARLAQKQRQRDKKRAERKRTPAPPKG